MSLIYSEEADPFSVKGGECLSSVERRQDPSLQRGERVSLLYTQGRETPSLKRGESISLLYREETGPFSVMGERERECLSSIYKGEALLL